MMLLFAPWRITPLIRHGPGLLWSQSICPIAAGDFQWAYAVTELLRNAVYTQYMDHMITNSIPDMAYNGYFATAPFYLWDSFCYKLK